MTKMAIFSVVTVTAHRHHPCPETTSPVAAADSVSGDLKIGLGR